MVSTYRIPITEPQIANRPIPRIPASTTTLSRAVSSATREMAVRAIIIKLHIVILMLACDDNIVRQLAPEMQRISVVDRISTWIRDWINVRLTNYGFVVVV